MRRIGWPALAAGVCVAAGAAWALPSYNTPSKDRQAKTSFKEALAHQEAGRYAEAIDAYEQSLKHDPRQAETLSNLGFCHRKLKHYSRAVSAYKDALDINPDLAEAHEYLGEAYAEMGKLALAEREYKTLLKLDPDEANELRRKIDAQTAAPTKKP